MFESLPTTYEEVKDWAWSDVQPYFEDLLNRELSAENIDQWMRDLTRISRIVGEIFSRVRIKTTQDITDEEAEAKYKDLLANFQPHSAKAYNALNQKLVNSGLMPDNFEIPFRNLKADIELFREENIELNSRAQVLALEYSKITGAQTVTWEGEERTMQEMEKVLRSYDREEREKAHDLIVERWLQDREAINQKWTQLFETRLQMAKNAGYDNYRAYAWKMRHRFDYTAEDSATFHNAILEVAVPAAKRIYERRQEMLGLDSLRPYDLDVEIYNETPLKPWETLDEFAERAEHIFSYVDPKLGEYYRTLRENDLLDLPNRKNKRVGAYCSGLPLTELPFVFMNAVGKGEDVRTLLHECGHAFHNFEIRSLPYSQQRSYPIEYAEVASMSMELLALPYITKKFGGYFSEEDAALFTIQHLEKIIKFWPYMAVVDSFQHWAYTHGDAAADPAACDDQWAMLWDKFMVGIDYSGLDDFKATGWHRKQHIYVYPFYYIEYGLAQLGAVQVWNNALSDQAGAVAAYRNGLSLGGTKTLPELFAATGVKFGFDAEILGQAVDLLESKINEGLSKISLPA